ncbi:MAG: DUF4394 domain-containing protein [Pyrinomonadaceae bacterium]
MRRILTALLAGVCLTFCAADRARAEGIIALTNQGTIVSFDSGTPNVINGNVGVTGLLGGDTLLGIDRRPQNGLVYGVGTSGRIYTINTSTGAATLVATSSIPPVGTSFGVDFNPVANRLRVISNTGQNLRINVEDGVAINDGALNYNGTPAVNVTNAAYTNNFPGGSSTSLLDIDTNINTLVLQNPPNNGSLVTIGHLGVDPTAVGGFDISGVTGFAYAALQINTATFSQLFRINLSTGAATLIGTIGDGSFIVTGIAVPVGTSPVPEPMTLILFATGLAGVAAKVRRRRRDAGA